MLNVAQVRLLEERVKRVISRTSELQRENGQLRQHLEGRQEQIKELEARIEEIISNQAEIEQGVLNALHRLDEVEDAVTEGGQEGRVVVELEASSESRDDASVVADSADSADSAAGDGMDADGTVDSADASDGADLPQPETEEKSGPELDIF